MIQAAFSLLIRFALLLAGAVIVIMTLTGASLGLGSLVALFTPLDLFQATMVVAAATAVGVLIIQFIFLVSVSDRPDRSAAGRSKRPSTRTSRFKDLNENLRNSPCPCGSGKKVKDCCGT